MKRRARRAGHAAAGPQRRRVMIAVCAVTVIVLVIAVVVLVVQRRAGAGSADGAQEPAAARATIGLLVSAAGRKALTPELDSVLDGGRLFPPGTTFSAEPGSWHQAGAFANVTGILRVPGRAAQVAEIGLMRRDGRWLVTFEAAR